MWPAPCSWRTRMWRIGESMIGSYTGRMAPPGRPKITSTPSISRDLIRAEPPLVFIVRPRGCSGFTACSVRVSFGWWSAGGRDRGRVRAAGENDSDLPWGGRSGTRTRLNCQRALAEYYERDGGSGMRAHRPTSVPAALAERQLGSTGRGRRPHRVSRGGHRWPPARSRAAPSPRPSRKGSAAARTASSAARPDLLVGAGEGVAERADPQHRGDLERGGVGGQLEATAASARRRRRPGPHPGGG